MVTPILTKIWTLSKVMPFSPHATLGYPTSLSQTADKSKQAHMETQKVRNRWGIDQHFFLPACHPTAGSRPGDLG